MKLPQSLHQFLNNPRKVLLAIMVVSVLLRLGSAIYQGNQVTVLPGIYDQISYHNLAIRVLDGHGFSFGRIWWPVTPANEPTAHWSYLYTSYLIGVYAIFGRNPLVARIIQAVVAGALMPWLTYRIAGRLFQAPVNRQPGLTLSEKVGLVAAGITAVYVYFFYYGGALITESFYITGILWAFDLALQIAQGNKNSWRLWLLLGLALGITILLRQLFLLFLPFLFLWMWWAARPKLTWFVVPVVLIGLMIAPWTIRNYNVFGRFVPLNTNSGYAFFWGNHPMYGTQFIPILPQGEYQKLIPQELLDQGLNEAELDSELLKRGIGFVTDDPWRYVLLSLSRIPSYFIFWPSAESELISNISRVSSFGLFLPFMLYGLFLALRTHYPSWQARLASPFTLFYLFVLVYTGVHVLTWTLIRYRLPIDAVMVIFAGWAIVELATRLKAGRS